MPELLARNLDKVQDLVDELSGHMSAAEKHIEQTVARVSDLELKSKFITAGGLPGDAGQRDGPPC